MTRQSVGLAALTRFAGRYWARWALIALGLAWPVDLPAQSSELQRLWQQALILSGRGANAEAVIIGQQALQLAEQESGPEHPNAAHSLLIVGTAYRELGRYDEAEPVMRRALGLFERALGPGDLNVATALNNLAFVYEAQGRYAEAEPLYLRSLRIREAVNGPDHPNVANILNNLAALYRAAGRYADAVTLLERSAAIFERALGRDHAEVAIAVNNLAEVLRTQGFYARAAPLYERALAIWQKTLGPEHSRIAVVLNNLAELNREQGHYGAAETLYKQALAIRERARGLDHPDVALGLNNLAALYRAQGRYYDAEALYRRSLAIREKALGVGHPDVARTLNNLARVYRSQRRFAEAEPLFKRAQQIWEKALGPDHPDLGYSLDNLARMYRQMGRYAEAEALFDRSLDIWRRAFGPEHPTVARALLHMAELFHGQKRYDDATRLFEQSIAMYERLMGPEHPEVAESLYRFAEAETARGGTAQALTLARRGTTIMQHRAAIVETERSEGSLAEQRATRENFMLHLALLNRALSGPVGETDGQKLTDEAFQVGQLAQASTTARAVSGMAARFATGGDALARLARQRQDAGEEWKRIDGELLKATSAPASRRDTGKEAQAQARLGELDRSISALDVRLAAEFPRYAEIANPQPYGIAEIRGFLRPGEVLLNYLVGDTESFVWAISPTKVVFKRLEINRETASGVVAWLREGLDPSVSFLLTGRLPRYDVATAYEFQQRVFGPIADALAGAETLLVVADGPLQSLPFGVLVRAPPAGPAAQPADYLKVAWLGWHYAISTLPSVSSLPALRGQAAKGSATEAFFGIGEPAPSEAGPPSSTAPVRSYAEALRRLPALPNAGEELLAIARALGADPGGLLLRGQATEANLRTRALERYRIVAFATHGLVAGDLLGLAEPALVLTPTGAASVEHDGVLTASKITELKLDADWVVLSACNTAAADGTPGAEGLSGLAKAFFYAGSRALLVSHWPVDSIATVKLTTATFAAMARDPALGRASALKYAMTALATDRSAERFAHPMFWAPFVVVGEGGALRR